ncbi:MAG: hypothetical protein ACXVB4_18305, partial [Pseudobdellovibrionaceae bacterium]
MTRNALFLPLILAVSSLDAKAVPASCQAVFRTEHVEINGTKLTQRDFDAIQTYEQLTTYTKTLVSQKMDAASLIIALEETQFAKKSSWWTDDVLFFLLHLEVNQGLKIPGTKFPFQDEKLQSKEFIQNKFDLERYILSQALSGKSSQVIIESLLTTPYVKSNNLQL